MAKRRYVVTQDFKARSPEGIEVWIKRGFEVWAEEHEVGDTIHFEMDALEYEVDRALFESSTKLKTP